MKMSGFSLFELMVAVAIVAILAAVAIPTYNTYILKSNRADGINTLMAMQLAEEKYRLSNSTYGSLAQAWSGVTTSPEGHYTLAISNVTATSYTITAVAVGGQSSDVEDGTACSTLTLTFNNEVTTRTPDACWDD